MLQDLLVRLARGLDARALAYMVIGGQAVLLYGEPRLTQDVDVTLGVGADRATEIVALCEELGLRIRVAEPARFAQETMVLPAQDDRSGLRVDFVFSHSEYEREALARANRIVVDDYNVAFVALEDLVIHKLIAARPRDLEDVRGVLLKQPQIDRIYLMRWLNDFSQLTGRNLIETFDSLGKHA